MGWNYYRTRYMDPKAGRFTTRDTIGIWGDPAEMGNGFSYVGNNPATYVDFTGGAANQGGCAPPIFGARRGR